MLFFQAAKCRNVAIVKCSQCLTWLYPSENHRPSMHTVSRTYTLVKGSRLWRRTVLSQYLEMLKLSFPLEYERVTSCGKKSIKYECAGQERTSAYKPLCCRSPLCPWCSATDTKHLVDYLRYRIHAIYTRLDRRIRFYRYEFVVPVDLRSKVGMEGLSVIDKLAKETLVKYLGKPKGLHLGIIQVPQWWHSSDPFGRKFQTNIHQHVHGICFDFGFDGEKVVPFGKLFVSDDKGFVRLRALWRSKLEARFGKSEARDVDCYIRFEEGGDQLKHRLEYMFRSSVKDVYEFVQSHGVPSGYDSDWVRQMLRGRGHAQRVHYYGWLAPVCQSPGSPFMQFLQLGLLSRKMYGVERKKVYCPKCGCLMERVPGAAVEDTDSLIARGERFVVYVSPWVVVELGDG
jgi:hypothetical protein